MCVGMNWVGMCFHDPLPSDVRRKNYIPSFSDFRQNPLNPKSPSEEKKKKIQSVSVELDLMKSRTTTSLFFFYKSGPVQSTGFPLPPRLVGCPHLPSAKFQSMDLKAQFRFFFFSSKHTRSGSLRSGSAAGHPEAERSKGH